MLETRSNVIETVAESTADRELVVSRLFEAPRDLVWDAWVDTDQRAQWWGPVGFSTTTQKFDLRVGGVWQQIMRGPDGTEYSNEGVFTEVVPRQRIAYDLRGGRKGSPEVTQHSTWIFEREGSKTRLSIHIVFPTAEARDTCIRDYKADEGGRQTLERLAEHLAKPPAGADLELHISRVFDAPRDLVYQAFTDPAMLAQWMGPKGCAAMDIEQDVRVGGKWRHRIHRTAVETGDGTDLWLYGTYLEVAPPERLVYTFAWENRQPNPHYQTTITVTFRELEGKTVMDFKQGTFDSVEERDDHNTGWTSAFECFAEFLLASTPAKATYDLVIDRIFDAPRELVWKVWTDASLAAEWHGPRGFKATHFEQDARPGGKWRLCLHADAFDPGDGNPRAFDLWQGGVFREIVPEERIVYTFAWDDPRDVGVDAPPHETLITVEFKERDGKTAMTFRQEFFPSAGERDGHTKGWNRTFDRLAELVQTKARTA